MQVQLKRGSLSRLRVPLLCVPLYEGESVREAGLAELDRTCGGQLAAVLRSGDFAGKLWSQAVVYNPKPSGPRRILLLGVGDSEALSLERVRQAAARAAQKAADMRVREVAILLPTSTDLDNRRVAEALTEGAILGDYRFDKYRMRSDSDLRVLETATLFATDRIDRQATLAAVEEGSAVAEAVCKSRDMVNAPANELTPTEMAERARASAKAYGFKCKIIERAEMERLDMVGILNVSKGSDQPPKFVVMEYDGAGPRTPRYAFVGKGLTFDAGGICIKPAPKMDEMKGDMGGGAAVIGAMEAIARLELPARVVGLVPCTENLLGASAYRPGDILRYPNGKSVVIDNTDAEGRLVLADALIYARRFKPKVIVDLATLTGAVLVALGQIATGVMGTDAALIRDLQDAGDRSFERLWELPLWEEFEELIRSPIADIKNTGGKFAGSITAAAFLKNFVEDTPWAHLDIAGTSYLDKSDGYRPQGGTGVGVRLLVEYLRGQLASE